jgi:hypothetical protein
MLAVPQIRKSDSAMDRTSFIPRLLVLQLAGIFLLLSCASTRPPRRLRVHVAPGFAGALQLTTCVPEAPGQEISTDARGAGRTAVCPNSDEDVVIVVIRGEQEYTAAPRDVLIRKTGDGIATSIEVQVRP